MKKEELYKTIKYLQNKKLFEIKIIVIELSKIHELNLISKYSEKNTFVIIPITKSKNKIQIKKY